VPRASQREGNSPRATADLQDGRSVRPQNESHSPMSSRKCPWMAS
jgi:hypothetical protein